MTVSRKQALEYGYISTLKIAFVRIEFNQYKSGVSVTESASVIPARFTKPFCIRAGISTSGV